MSRVAAEVGARAAAPGAPFGASGARSGRPLWLALCAIALIRAYKTLVSPLLPSACRFEPTCSEYASEAIRRHGLARGGLLAARRLARCRPGPHHGHDPVP